MGDVTTKAAGIDLTTGEFGLLQGLYDMYIHIYVYVYIHIYVYIICI